MLIPFLLQKMNFLIIFVLVITIHLTLNEACKENHVVFHNELAPGIVLNITCHKNSFRNPPFRTHLLKYKDPFHILEFEERHQLGDRTSWHCTLSHGIKPKYCYPIDVYSSGVLLRCGQLRSWTAKLDGIWFTKNYWSPPEHVLNWLKA